MRRLAPLLGISLYLLASISATFAQSVQQYGSVTRNHIAGWSANGVIQDGGSASDSPITSMGVDGQFCVMSDRATAAGRNLLCFNVATAGAASISLQNYGTASPQSFNLVLNGVSYPIPGSLAGITIGTTAVFSGTNGNCLNITGGVVGQQNCQAGATIGVTSITSGTPNGLLYDNAGVFGNLATGNNGVLVTSGGGVPSISTTLPSALSIPSPTITGTITAPDSSTWASTGLSKLAALSVGNTAVPSAGNVSITGQYQISGTQIAASNLSNGTTGSGSIVLATGPTIGGVPLFTGLSSGTCSNGLALNSGNQAILVACPGAASSITVGTTTVGSGATGNLLYNNAGTLGNETIASVLTAGNGISITGTTNATIAQSLTNTTLQASPGAPANVGPSASFLMEGMGTTCHLTPAYSTRILLSFNFDVETGTAGVNLQTKIMFGTGTAPANNAALTGTQVGNVHSAIQQVGGDNMPVTHSAYVITGLTPATAYWFDVALAGDGTHATVMLNPSCSAMEF